jgi:hypothetical protein
MGCHFQYGSHSSPVFSTFKTAPAWQFSRSCFQHTVWCGGTLGAIPLTQEFAKELLLSESFQSLSSQKDYTRPNHSTLMNSGRETRKNGPSPKMFSGSSEQELGSAISTL